MGQIRDFFFLDQIHSISSLTYEKCGKWHCDKRPAIAECVPVVVFLCREVEGRHQHVDDRVTQGTGGGGGGPLHLTVTSRSGTYIRHSFFLLLLEKNSNMYKSYNIWFKKNRWRTWITPSCDVLPQVYRYLKIVTKFTASNQSLLKRTKTKNVVIDSVYGGFFMTLCLLVCSPHFRCIKNPYMSSSTWS